MGDLYRIYNTYVVKCYIHIFTKLHTINSQNFVACKYHGTCSYWNYRINLAHENYLVIKTLISKEVGLRLLWDTEAITIKKEINNPLSQPLVNLKFDWTHNQYQVKLPYKVDYRLLNNGYITCKAILNQVTARLLQDRSCCQ